MAAPLALLAMLVELALGYPARATKLFGHPVIWMGALISWCDRHLNQPTDSGPARRRAGVATLAVLLIVTGIAAWVLEAALLVLPFGLLFAGLAASTLIAQRSLYTHVACVADALERGTITDARLAVSHIVGRDTESLDEAAIARAAIESLAENFSDGVVSPVVWIVAGGLTGGAVYKAINTADSMIGHRSDAYENFGRPAAKLDDIANWPGARLSGLLLVASARLMPAVSASGAWSAMRRDAAKHASPNAGYPEAAMAGALDIALGGPHTYGESVSDGAWLNAEGRAASANDLRTALRLYICADALLIAIVAILAGITAIA